MTKITQAELRQLYLKDLNLPDVFHGRTTPKVKRPQQWEKIQTILRNATGEPRELDPYGDVDIWVWSDIHWGHGNIIKYANRPFPTRQLMDACLIGNYQNTVKPQDVCIFGGDIAFLKEADTNHILAQLPGYKIQMVGNHDITREGKVMELGFDETHLCRVIDVDDHDFNIQLLFTHYPLDTIPDGCISIHGHIHDNLAGPKNFNMCVEHTNYKPMHIKEFVKRARKIIGAEKGFVVI
jgi:calcineurin-like phosphoesterase family protein